MKWKWKLCYFRARRWIAEAYWVIMEQAPDLSLEAVTSDDGCLRPRKHQSSIQRTKEFVDLWASRGPFRLRPQTELPSRRRAESVPLQTQQRLWIPRRAMKGNWMTIATAIQSVAAEWKRTSLGISLSSTAFLSLEQNLIATNERKMRILNNSPR